MTLRTLVVRRPHATSDAPRLGYEASIPPLELRWARNAVERQIEAAAVAIERCRGHVVLSFSTQGSGTESVHPGPLEPVTQAVVSEVGGWDPEELAAAIPQAGDPTIRAEVESALDAVRTLRKAHPAEDLWASVRTLLAAPRTQKHLGTKELYHWVNDHIGTLRDSVAPRGTDAAAALKAWVDDGAHVERWARIAAHASVLIERWSVLEEQSLHAADRLWYVSCGLIVRFDASAENPR